MTVGLHRVMNSVRESFEGFLIRAKPHLDIVEVVNVDRPLTRASDFADVDLNFRRVFLAYLSGYRRRKKMPLINRPGLDRTLYEELRPPLKGEFGRRRR